MPLDAKKLLKFDPETEILFKETLNKSSTNKSIPITNVLKLTNIHDKMIAFKIKTTAPSAYTVSPTQGFISPAADVSIALHFYKEDSDRNGRFVHRFLIQAIPCKDESIPIDRFWKELSKDTQIYEHKIRCNFDLESPTEPITFSSTVGLDRNYARISARNQLERGIDKKYIQIICAIIFALIAIVFVWSLNTKSSSSVSKK
ncbi:Vesicle-associated membrane protein-associated protein A [Sarcoptes scabiei]|uniref:MSP domain containing protein n=1 Tax=Sarcoptes scabiei TaxID=52283 RepID=A0A132A8Y4_SARSC|nr:Vesicle-associated membrane protein-associated protein A [Sarcoptes scabiei]KPM07461.1 MSP domain containing protein [Sarcoptes scabiei]UXI19733.1 hypothetical protein NH340_JMT05676 [Sarcoptes scabiei]